MPRLMEKRFRNKINLWQGDGPAHALSRALVNGHNGIGSLFIGIALVNKVWAVGEQACGIGKTPGQFVFRVEDTGVDIGYLEPGIVDARPDDRGVKADIGSPTIVS